MTNEEYERVLEEHYVVNWGRPVARRKLQRGRIHELPAPFEILIFERTPGVFIFATKCMSQPDDRERLELHLLAPREFEEAAVEVITAVAHYHRTGERLGLGHTVNFGTALAPNGNCSFGLVSLPYLDGEKVEWLRDPLVRFLWLIPITEAEVRYKQQHGVEALEQRFEQEQFNYVDPKRPSVA